MKLRKATLADGPAVVALYREAQAFLAAQGIDQWQDGYPNEETFQEDVARGESWLLEEAGQVVATACLGLGREPTYDTIYQGSLGRRGPGVRLPPPHRRVRRLQGQGRALLVLPRAGAPGQGAGPALPAGRHPPGEQNHAARHGEKRPVLPGRHLPGGWGRAPGL